MCFGDHIEKAAKMATIMAAMATKFHASKMDRGIWKCRASVRPSIRNML
jgi:hypothetical protein